VRLLAFNHFYDQDLSALAAGLGDEDTLDIIPYQRLHRLARAHFPAEVFTGVETAVEDRFQAAWDSYKPTAHGFADWLAAAYEPSVFVVPSDAFFYLRPVISRLAALGVPTVVVQKETSISPAGMESHSVAVGASVPFISEAMTVCSERHKDFWVRSGADPARIHVTGQPRFDVYARARESERRPGPPRVLYLSYDDVAYLPQDYGKAFEGTWRDLRRETEEALATAAGSGVMVTAKVHPQQPVGANWLGPDVAQAARDADTRELVVEADVVVAFQTTGVFEAAVAGRPVLYPAWGDVFERTLPTLLPFHLHPELATHVRSAGELRAALARLDELPRPREAARALAEEHLGPVDGHATERALAVVRRCAGEHQAFHAVPPPGGARQLKAALRGGASPVLGLGAKAATRFGRPVEADALRRRSEHWRQQGLELVAIKRQARGRRA
jgi:hypothetical protein